MSEMHRPQLLAWLAAGALVVVLGALWVRGGIGGEESAGAAATVAVRSGGGAGQRGHGGNARVVVHVAGAVRRPGVYRLPAGTRIASAVRQAGGATQRADLDALNLAARVEDGRQVLVPERAGAVAGAATGAGRAPPGAAAPGTAPAPVSLATATLEQLDTLPGVGPATAQAILAYRQEHGGFGSVDELDAVPGIGPATLEALRDLVTP